MEEPVDVADRLFTAGKFEASAEAAAEALQKSGQMMSSEVAKLLSRRSEVRECH